MNSFSSATAYEPVPSPGQPQGAGPSSGTAADAGPAGVTGAAVEVGEDALGLGLDGAGGVPPDASDDEDRPGQRRRRLKLAAGVLLAAALLGGIGYFVAGRGGNEADAAGAAASGQARQTISKAVVATIDGKPVLEAELTALLANGADRAVAIDRAINKVLAAEAARSRYADDARTLATAAERDVLANLYLQRRNQEMLQAVTDEQIADYYKANVRDEDYASFKLRYYLTRDQADANNVRALLERGDKAAVAKLAPLGNAADGFLPFQGIPYGLGQVVRRARNGEVIGPVLVRDGLLVLVLDDVRAGKKPELDTVKNEIRTLLADRQLGEELLNLRKKAQIQLN